MRLRPPALPLLSSLLLAAACTGGAGPIGAPGPDTSPGIIQPDGRTDTPSPASPGTPQAPEPQPEPPAYVHEWVVSPSGRDMAEGTASAPLRTISRALVLAGPGDLIRVRAGTYVERLLLTGSVRAGTANAPITLEGEGMPRIILGSEPGALVLIERPYWRIRGFNIDVQNRAAYGVAFTGDTEGTVLSDSEIHHATYGAGVSFHDGAHGATLENNHIHHIFIRNKDAHGVLIQPTARNITVRGNHIHDNSGDSIQCYSPDGSVPSSPADGLLIEGNDLHSNVEQSLDIKTCTNVIVRGNTMHHARHDPRLGGNGAMVVHMSARNVLIEDNEFFDAGVAIGVGGNRYGPMPSGIVIRRNRIHDMITEGGMTGGGLILANSTGTQVYNNTFTRLQGPAITLGFGDGGPTQNLVLKNNIIDAARAMDEGAQAPGLTAGSNLYRSGATFARCGEVLDLPQWRARGQDVGSSETQSPVVDPQTLSPGEAAIDQGEPVGLDPTCGAGPDIGAVESGC